MPKVTVKQLVDELTRTVKAEETLKTLLESKEVNDAMHTTELRDPRSALTEAKDIATNYRLLLQTTMENTTIEWPAPIEK